jgi:hypothetical protein
MTRIAASGSRARTPSISARVSAPSPRTATTKASGRPVAIVARASSTDVAVVIASPGSSARSDATARAEVGSSSTTSTRGIGGVVGAVIVESTSLDTVQPFLH